jgi:hypothetical protein
MRDFTEINDGRRDAAPFLQQALDQAGEVRIPAGIYRLGATLQVCSNTSIVAEPGAVFRLADGVGRHIRNFMITNANPGNGNADIALRGGLWDANNVGNPRGGDPNRVCLAARSPRQEHDPFACTGVAINNWRFSKGAGAIRRVLFEDVDLAKTQVSASAPAIVRIALAVDDLGIRRLHRRTATALAVKTLVIDNRQDLDMQLDGRSCSVASDFGFVLPDGHIGALRLQAKGSRRVR